MQKLLHRLQQEMSSEPPKKRVCQGTLLSRAQYLIDIESWEYGDARLHPRGNMSADEIEQWTAPIFEEECKPPIEEISEAV
jgi:hypothetical protein